VLVGILQLNVEIMDLLLQELSHGISLTHDSVMLLHLALKLGNGSIPIFHLLVPFKYLFSEFQNNFLCIA
jgi:hypothetical protein